MLLLIFASIWIFKKFRLLAGLKGLPEKKWGWYGVATYLGFALGGQLIGGFIIGATNSLYLLEGMNQYAFAFICYGLGGIATYVLYQQLDKKENHIEKGLDDFGLDEFEDEK